MNSGGRRKNSTPNQQIGRILKRKKKEKILLAPRYWKSHIWPKSQDGTMLEQTRLPQSYCYSLSPSVPHSEHHSLFTRGSASAPILEMGAGEPVWLPRKLHTKNCPQRTDLLTLGYSGSTWNSATHFGPHILQDAG